MKGAFVLSLLLLGIVTNAQNKKLVIIGSSTSACSGASDFWHCYVALLDAHYDGIGQPIDIVQLAVPGYNVYQGMPTGYVGPGPSYQPDPNNNITKALSLNPDAILVNYPSNAFDVLTRDSVMRCFRTIKAIANAAGKRCFITTTQPRHSSPNFDDFSERQKLKEIRDSIVLQFGLYAVNFWDNLADPITYMILPTVNADNIHLNDAGHQILFERVRDEDMFSAALPVKLNSFTAKQHQGQVNISWSVSDDVTGTLYEVQRSKDATSFETIRTVTAGNPARGSYVINDQTVAGGVFYYRLKITENSGSFFSYVIKLLTGKNKLSLKNFSIDPLQQQLVVKLIAAESIPVQFSFINSLGQRTYKNLHVLQPGENRLSFVLNDLPSGTYWAECISGREKVFTKSFNVY